MEGNVRGKTAPLPKKAVSLLYNNSLFPPPKRLWFGTCRKKILRCGLWRTDGVEIKQYELWQLHYVLLQILTLLWWGPCTNLAWVLMWFGERISWLFKKGDLQIAFFSYNRETNISLYSRFCFKKQSHIAKFKKYQK